MKIRITVARYNENIDTRYYTDVVDILESCADIIEDTPRGWVYYIKDAATLDARRRAALQRGTLESWNRVAVSKSANWIMRQAAQFGEPATI